MRGETDTNQCINGAMRSISSSKAKCSPAVLYHPAETIPQIFPIFTFGSIALSHSLWHSAAPEIHLDPFNMFDALTLALNHIVGIEQLEKLIVLFVVDKRTLRKHCHLIVRIFCCALQRTDAMVVQ